MAEPPSSITPTTTTTSGHLTAMQLFYELKQKFPTAPDPVVSECIRQSGHDLKKCEAFLRASCASRGFPAAPLPASTSSDATFSTTSAASSDKVGRRGRGGGRRFSAPPPSSYSAATSAGVCPATRSSSTDVSSSLSRERSKGRNSMCALSSERSSCVVNTTRATSSTSTSVETICDNVPAETPTATNLRSKLRPTFLNTRPQHHLSNNNNNSNSFPTRRNSNSFIDDDRFLRSPFLGGPLQEPHKYQCRRRSSSASRHQEETEAEEYYSETYNKCSVNNSSHFEDLLPLPPRSREPTPPPRPPLPANMVQDPLLPPYSHTNRYFHTQEEDFFQDYEVSVNCSAHGVHVTSTCSSPIAAPVNSPLFQQQLQPLRHTASLHVHPTPHYLSRPSSEPRSYTSVNLTLRPATSEPQPPIDIRSASRLTYSTSSFNPIQGYQSQLHIEIGTGCGTISAIRTNTQQQQLSPVQQQNHHHRPSSLCGVGGGGGGTPSTVKQHQVLVRTISPLTPDKQLVFGNTPQQVGLARQMERKARLEAELRKEKERLRDLRAEVLALKDDLQKRKARKAIAPLRGPLQSASQRAEQLRAEIRSLQEECKHMTQEVDLQGSQVPLGETDEEFYQNIYTGQRGFVLPQENLPHPFQGSFNMPSPLPLRSSSTNVTSSSGPPLRPALGRGTSVDEDEEEDGPHWTCSVCTFRNHPALRKCEQCEMPRITLDVTEAETQDIHIRVTHSNFPSRRVVHSWVV